MATLHIQPDWQALLEEWSKKGQHWTFNTVTGKPELVEDE
jgi:hypothetical protein